jgi:uncharacterized membrane protein YdbT with pleckstrin-like domain
MSISTTEMMAVLQPVHVFRLLKPPALQALAALCEVHEFAAGEVVVAAGAAANFLFIVASGRVAIGTGKASAQVLGENDYFGAQAALPNGRHPAAATPLEPTLLLALPAPALQKLQREHPSIKDALLVRHRSAALLRRRRYAAWLRDNENVLLICRTHWVWLLARIWQPGLLLVAALGASWLLQQLAIDGWPALLLGGALALLWLLLLYVDWLDDTYVVTDKRIICDQRLLLLYRTRTEAPLQRVRSVDLEQGFFDQLLNVGDVSARTLAGIVHFPNVHAPQAVREIINELVQRAQNAQRKAHQQSLVQSVRVGIGWQTEPAANTPPAPQESKPSLLHSAGAFLGRLLPAFTEYSGNAIIWRKHPLVLLSRTAPGLLGMLLCALLALLLRRPGMPSGPFITGSLLLLALAAFCLAWYYYADWHNDTYTLTPDRLIDMEKKPLLGSLIQRSAPLENLVNVQYSRPGFWASIFNFGSVTIETGGETGDLDFNMVMDPLFVQQTILNRMEQRQERQQAAERERQRTEMVDWLKAYAQVTQPAPPPAQPGAPAN